MRNKPKFANCVSEIKIVYKTKVKAADRIGCHDTECAAHNLFEFFDKETIELTEQCYVLIADAGLRALGVINVGIGTSDNSPFDIKKAIQAALLCNGKYIFMAHNHPSCRLTASTDDRKVTQQMSEACKVVGMHLCDHFIFDCDGRYYSFHEEGLI